jgi:hypothetical protein
MDSFKWTSPKELEFYQKLAVENGTKIVGVDYAGNLYRYAALGARMPGNEKANIYVMLSDGKSFIIPAKYVIVDGVAPGLEIHYLSMRIHQPTNGYPSLHAVTLTPDSDRPALIPYDEKLYNVGSK